MPARGIRSPRALFADLHARGAAGSCRWGHAGIQIEDAYLSAQPDGPVVHAASARLNATSLERCSAIATPPSLAQGALPCTFVQEKLSTYLQRAERSAQLGPMLVGYVRSTREGLIPAAEDATLRNAGCEVVFADPCVGTAAEQQPELARALESLGPQDVLLVTRLDRLAGGLGELITRMVQVQAKGAAVRTLQNAAEPASTSAKEVLEALLSFEKELAEARSHQRKKSALLENAERPRLLDDAAERLAASRAHTDEPSSQIARSIGASARKRRRAATSS